MNPTNILRPGATSNNQNTHHYTKIKWIALAPHTSSHHNSLDMIKRLHDIAAVRLILYSLLGIILWAYPTKGLQDGLCWITAITFIVLGRKNIRSVWANPAGIAIAILCAYTIAALPLSNNPELSSRELWKFLDFFALAFGLSIFLDSRKKLEETTLYIASSLTFLFGADLYRQIATFGDEAAVWAHGYEPFVLFHSNIQSVACGIAMFFLIYHAWRWRHTAFRLWFCIAGILIQVAYQYVMASRGPQAALAATIALSGFVLTKGWKIKTAVAVTGAILLTLFFAFNPRIGISEPLKPLKEEKSPLEFIQHELSGRDVVWAHTWELIKQRPIFGHGTGKRNFVEYYHSEESNPLPSPHKFVHPHNYWLYVLFAQGFVGLALHLAVWGLIIATILRRLQPMRTTRERLYLGMLCISILFVFIYGMADWPSSTIFVFMVIFAAIILAATRRDLKLIGINAPATPLGPGPDGRVLAFAPFNGGIGGIERLTRSLADWADSSDYTLTIVAHHNDFPEGPFTLHNSNNVRVIPGDYWNKSLHEHPYEFVYIIPAGLSSHAWKERIRKTTGLKVTLDLDPERKYLDVTDVLHCETPRLTELPKPHVVGIPHPMSTVREPSDTPCKYNDFYLAVFTPYDKIKGQRHIPKFLDAVDKPLVWCYDPVSFSLRKRKLARRVNEGIQRASHPNLIHVVAPSQEMISALYTNCAGYLCFSDRETLCYGLLDAVLQEKPICSTRVGVCNALKDFEPTEDFSNPTFKTYEKPELKSYGEIFEEARRAAE